MSVCCPLAECSSIIPSHPSLCKSFFYFFCTFLSILWKTLIPSQFFELIFLLLFLSDWWVSSLMPDIWRLRWFLMCPEDDCRIPLSFLCLSPLMCSRREDRADFYDNQIKYLMNSQNENGFIFLDKKREISDDIPQENWQLAIVAIAHYLRRYDA